MRLQIISNDLLYVPRSGIVWLERQMHIYYLHIVYLLRLSLAGIIWVECIIKNENQKTH